MKNVKIENAKEEIKEIVERCIKCGKCNSLCPVLRILREQQYSPRGKAIILNYSIEKIVYKCTLCKACEIICPLHLPLCTAFIKARNVLSLQKKAPSVNKELLTNLSKTGNIFGIEEKKDKES